MEGLKLRGCYSKSFPAIQVHLKVLILLKFFVRTKFGEA